LLLIHGKEKFEIMKKNVNKAVLPPNNSLTMAQALKADFSKTGDAGFAYAALVAGSLCLG